MTTIATMRTLDGPAEQSRSRTFTTRTSATSAGVYDAEPGPLDHPVDGDLRVGGTIQTVFTSR